ncbi:MAG TPA: asparagine synthase-related protein, partial [Solirubrobacteraceae bacterium]|nr:asparagine synthase-related protein [Solirubrobacteraceae bacterium]
MLDRCLFVVAAPAAVVAERAQRLARFYGRGPLSLTDVPAAGAAVGCIGPESLVFGSPDPLGLGVVVAVEDDRVVVRTGATNVVALYAAGAAWSTHATAAAYLGTGRVELRDEAAAELAALGFVPGDATTLHGVRAVPAGTVVEVTRGGSRERQVPVDVAGHGAAEEELLDALREQTAGAAPLTLGLSGGLDSRAVAAGLADAGIAFEAVTWGADDWPDVAGARRVAAALGVPHRVV